MFYYEELGDAVIRTRKNDVHHLYQIRKADYSSPNP